MKQFWPILFITTSALAKTDLKGLTENGNLSPREVKAQKNVPQATKKQSAFISEQSQDVLKLRESLKGLNLVLNSQPNSPNRIELLLKKAFLHISIVREMGRKRTSATQLTEEENKHLTVAKDILNKMLQPSAKLSDAKKASVYYLLGLAAYEYENYKLQQKYFIDALNLDPKSQQAGSLALMVAEQYFDDEDFANALKYYNGYLGVMNDKQKDLALYKSAWCFISTQQNEKAEAELLKVVQSNRQSGFQKDSLRDLAFISVRHRDELGVIRYGQQKIINDSDRYEFYSLALKYFFQMQTRQSLNRLIGIVLKTEKKLDVRLEIMGHQVNEFRRDYLSSMTLSYYQGIRLELEKNKTNLDAPELIGFKKNFQSDMEYFVYSITQVYQSNVQTEKSLPRDKVASLLQKTILFYDYFFPESKNKILIFQILADLCVDQKSYTCVTQVYNKGKTYKPEDKAWNDLRLKLRANQLMFADELYNKEPAKHEALVIYLVQEFKKDYPTHELVLKGLRRTLQIYTQKNDLPNVEKNYSEIFQKEKSAENLYNWAFTVFKQNRFSEVIEMVKDQYMNDTKLNQLRSETFLKLADKESQGDNFKNYETYIVENLKINKDPDKAALIYSDWIQKSLNLKVGGAEHALEVFNSVPQNIRSKPIFDSYSSKLASSFISTGDFERLSKINLNRPTKTKEDSLTYFKLVHFFSIKDASLPGWVASMDSLDNEKKNYLLGLIVLLKPNLAIEYLKKSKLNDPNRADLYLLALKMEHKSDEFNLSKEDKKILGKKSESIQAKATVQPAILSEIKKVNFPTAKMSFQKYNAAVEKLVPTVKKIREKILKSFQAATIEQKLLIVPEAETLEAKTAKVIEEAPLPPGLDDLQKADYQSGINELAKEFVEQATEYKKMFDGLSEKMVEISKQKAMDTLPEIDMNKWIWPNNEVVKKALTLHATSNIQAQLYIDAQLAEKFLSDIEHSTTRAGLLAMSQNSEVMREYIKQELLQQQREELIQKWKSLGPLPLEPISQPAEKPASSPATSGGTESTVSE